MRLAAAGLPVICIDARHMKAAVSAIPVKTDRIDLDNHIRGVLEAFGLRVGTIATGQLEARVWTLIGEGDAQIRWVVGTLETTRAAVTSQLALLHRAAPLSGGIPRANLLSESYCLRRAPRCSASDRGRAASSTPVRVRGDLRPCVLPPKGGPLLKE